MYNEHSIVWLEDPTNFDYVRELHTYERTRTEQPSIEGVNGRLVAYATLDPSAEPSTRVRSSGGCGTWLLGTPTKVLATPRRPRILTASPLMSPPLLARGSAMTELVTATYDPANNMVYFSAPIPLLRRGGWGSFLPCSFDVYAHRRKRANAACEQMFVMGGTYDRLTRLLWTGAIEQVVQTPTALAGFTGHLVVTIFYRD